MKQFLAQYLFNLWVYGSQTMILYFAGRKVVTIYATKQLAKTFSGASSYSKPAGVGDIRNERTA